MLTRAALAFGFLVFPTFLVLSAYCLARLLGSAIRCLDRRINSVWVPAYIVDDLNLGIARIVYGAAMVRDV